MNTRTLPVLALAAVAACGLAACDHNTDMNHSKNEMSVQMSELPSAVRATLDRESAGGRVMEIEKEMKNGQTVYSADVTSADGMMWDVMIAADGRLMSKEMEKHGQMDGMNNNGMNNNGMRNDGMRNDGMNNNGMRNDGMNNNGMRNDGMNNNGMRNDGMNNNGMRNDGMNNNGMRNNNMNNR